MVFYFLFLNLYRVYCNSEGRKMYLFFGSILIFCGYEFMYRCVDV